MSNVKCNFVKLFACVFAVCVGFAIATMLKANVVSATSELSSFEVIGTSIRNGETDGLTGLRFTTKVTEDWLSENQAEKYSFGTLIAPTDKLGKFDSTKNPTENMSLIDGDNIIAVQRQAASEGFEFTASIIYDEQVVIDYLAKRGSEVSAKEILEKLYKKSFTAIPYAVIEKRVIYAKPYSDSMYNTALKTVALAIENEDQNLMKLVGQYVGVSNTTVQSAYVSVEDNTVVVDSVENFQASEETAILANGEILVLDKDYTIDALGNIVLAGELQASANSKTVYVVDGDCVHVIDVLYVDKVLKSASDVKNYLDSTTWQEDSNPFNLVTVLANDVDMSAVQGVYGVSSKNVGFNGYFDGRGHVISNLVKNTANSSNPIFGDLKESAYIGNVAFNNFISTGYDVNSGWFASNLRGTVENIYVRFSLDSEVQQMFEYTKEGSLRNVIIEAPYDENLDANAWAIANAGAWGRTYLARMIGASTTNMTNVHVISQLPLVIYGTSSSYREPTFTDGEVTSWNTWFAYGENETKVWHDFDYFHKTTGGLGLEIGAQTVENTQVVVDGQSMHQGVTRVWKGVKRYETLKEMVSANPNGVASLVNTGMWKMKDGSLVWAKGDMKEVKFVSGVEYDASTGVLKSTAWSGESIRKVILNGVQLSTGENGGLVLDENGDIIGIRAKINDSDKTPGISYEWNNINSSQIISDVIVLETENAVYNLRDCTYWTKIIYDVADLKEAMGYNVNYTLQKLNYTASTNVANKGILTLAVTDGGVYYTNNYNVGLYRLGADIDMEKTDIGYTANALNGDSLGGYAGLLDGYGYSIKNFKPNTQGLLGSMNSYNRGSQACKEFGTSQLDIKSIPSVPTIRNIAFENVITSANNPVIAVSAGYADAFVGRPPVIENVYVTVSSEASGIAGIIKNVNSHVTTNNVYVVCVNDFNNFVKLSDNNMYRFVEREGVTLPIDGIYYNPIATSSYRDSALFGKLASGSPNKILNSVSYTTNVYVVSKLPVTYYTVANTSYYGYYRNTNAMDETTELLFTHLGGYETVRGGVVAYGYASNETTSVIPVIYKIRDNIATEFNTYYDGGLAGSNKTSGLEGYFCPVCGEATITDTSGRCTLTAKCNGELVKNAGVVGKGIWSSPIVYEWTIHNLATEAGTNFTNTNGTFKFAGVKKFLSVADMKTAECDFSSFIGAEGNDMWKVVEGELVWVGAVA